MDGLMAKSIENETVEPNSISTEMVYDYFTWISLENILLHLFFSKAMGKIAEQNRLFGLD